MNKTTDTTYEACITRIENKPGDLMNRYKVMVYRYIHAGICGPFTEEVEVNGMGTVIEVMNAWGFEMTDFPGPVNSNGFAIAPLALIEEAS